MGFCLLTPNQPLLNVAALSEVDAETAAERRMSRYSRFFAVSLVKSQQAGLTYIQRLLGGQRPTMIDIYLRSCP